jgi:acyl transferase domain-containing protein
MWRAPYPAQRLSVEAAFHTPHVQHALASFSREIDDIPLRAPRVPVYANTPGASYGDDPEANREVLTGQIVNTVDFEARLREMYADGFRVFVEFGPKRTLSLLVEQTLGEQGVDIVWTDIGAGGDGALALKQAAVQLAVLGLPLSGIDLYDEPVPPPPVASAVARVLDGPQFATIARQEEYERVLGTPYRSAEPIGREPEPAAERQPAATAHDDPLGRAAAVHLTMHTRYLDGQLRTADQLVSLLNQGINSGSAEAVLSGITAIRDHSMALGEAHARAGEVLLLVADGSVWRDDLRIYQVDNIGVEILPTGGAADEKVRP